MNIEEKSIEVLKHCKDRNFSAFDEIYFDDGTNMCIFQAIETLLTAYEKEKEKNKSARERIEYYLLGNMRLNDFDERNKELKKLEKILEE